MQLLDSWFGSPDDRGGCWTAKVMFLSRTFALQESLLLSRGFVLQDCSKKLHAEQSSPDGKKYIDK